MRSLAIIIVILSCFGASCATKTGTGAVVGAGVGGAIGGLAGGPTGLLIGALAGGALGAVTGNAMDEQDRRRAAASLEQNQAAEWRDEQGNLYRMEPTGTTYRQGRECRNFRMHAEIDGRPDHVTGTACRRSDGSWETIST